MRRLLPAILFAVPVLLSAAPLGSDPARVFAASVQGQAAEGRKIAVRWCASCHQVSDDQAVVDAQAPAFASIAGRYTGEDGSAALETFLADPHPVMPDMNLTRREIGDLVAFINSLAE